MAAPAVRHAWRPVAGKAAAADGLARDHGLNAYRRLPLAFEQNGGQADPGISFVAHAPGYALGLTRSSALLALHRSTGHRGGKRRMSVRTPTSSHISTRNLSISFVKESSAARLVAGGRLRGKVNYLIGRDRSRWRTGIPTFREVVYRGVWPGIDASLGGSSGAIEYVYTVAPRADARRIVLSYHGATGLSLDKRGNLAVSAGRGRSLRQIAPRAYQRIAGHRRSVACRYVLRGDRVSLALGAYDHSRRLVIDPYVTYLGGSGNADDAFAMALDTNGNAYVTGKTAGGFPTTSGAYDTTHSGTDWDAFISKIAPSGQGGADLLYSTYIGGTAAELGLGIAVDGSGSAYVTGKTGSSDFPTTSGAYQTSYPAGASSAAFVAKLSPSGTGATDLLYSTYFGGTGGFQPSTAASGIAVDGSGHAYIAGGSSATGLPTTAGAYQTTFGGVSDAFVAKFNLAGQGNSDLLYSSYIGGNNGDTAHAIALDSSGHAYLTGSTTSTNFPATTGAYQTASNAGSEDAFVAKLNPGGGGTADLLYSTYLGGTKGEQGLGIAVDSAGHAYIAGSTLSSNYPTTSGAAQTTYGTGFGDAAMSKIDPGGHGASDLLYSTYLGGTGDDYADAIAIDSSGDAYLTGVITSTDFPTTAGAYQTTSGGGSAGTEDGFLAKIHPGAQGGADLTYSSYLGGSGTDEGSGVAVDGSRNAFVAGFTDSTDFPKTSGAYHTTLGGTEDAFLAELGTPADTLRSTSTSVSCAPPTLIVGEDTTCTAIVTDTASGTKSVPTGLFAFSDTGASTGTYSCTPAGNGITGQAQCSVTITPTASGTPTIRADYSGDASHSTSHGTTSLTVNQIPAHFRFSASTYSAGEGDGTATITVERVGDTSRPASVGFATSDGTATVGSDYPPASGALSFAIGETSKTFTVTITNDNQPENDETIDLTLSSASPDVFIDSPGTATLTIVDNDFGLKITSGPDGPTTQTTPSFTFTTDPPSGPADTCWMDSGSPASCGSPYASSMLADGPHTFHVQSTLSGATRNASRDFFVDTVAPSSSASIVPFVGGERVGTGETYVGTVGMLTQQSDPDPSSGVAETRCVLDPASAPASFDAIPADGCPLTTDTPGQHDYYVASRDNAGNAQAPRAYRFTILRTPDTTITSGPTGFSVSAPTFTFSSDTAGATFECRVDDGPWTSCTSPHTRYALSLNAHTFYVRAVSAAGARDPSPASRSFTLGKTTVSNQCEVQVPWDVPRVVSCPILRDTCPVGSKCTLSGGVSMDHDDTATAWLTGLLFHFGPPNALSPSGRGGGTNCWSHPERVGPSAAPGLRCPQSASKTNLGLGDAIGAYCETGEKAYSPGQSQRGPDDARVLFCRATLTIQPAASLEAVAGGSTVQVIAPSAGTLGIGSSTIRLPRIVAAAKRRKRVPLVAPVKVKVKTAGVVTIPLKLSKTAKRTLSRRHKLPLTIKISFLAKGAKNPTVRSQPITLTSTTKPRCKPHGRIRCR